MTRRTYRIANEIMRVLMTRSGHQNAMSAQDIARAVGMSERSVRRIISEVWESWAEQGIFICSKSGGGYWVAADYEEAVAYRDWLASSGTHLSGRAAVITRVCRKSGIHLDPPPPKKGTPCRNRT
jgi:transcriptional antiterminator